MSMYVWNMRECRQYHQFRVPNVIEEILGFLKQKGFSIKHNRAPGGSQYISAHKNGKHLNFVPGLKISFIQNQYGNLCFIHYYARIRKTGLVSAVATVGLSAMVGAGNLKAHVADANSFVRDIWQWIDSLAFTPGVIQHREGFSNEPDVATLPTLTATSPHIVHQATTSYPQQSGQHIQYHTQPQQEHHVQHQMRYNQQPASQQAEGFPPSSGQQPPYQHQIQQEYQQQYSDRPSENTLKSGGYAATVGTAAPSSVPPQLPPKPGYGSAPPTDRRPVSVHYQNLEKKLFQFEQQDMIENESGSSSASGVVGATKTNEDTRQMMNHVKELRRCMEAINNLKPLPQTQSSTSTSTPVPHNSHLDTSAFEAAQKQIVFHTDEVLGLAAKSNNRDESVAERDLKEAARLVADSVLNMLEDCTASGDNLSPTTTTTTTTTDSSAAIASSGSGSGEAEGNPHLHLHSAQVEGALLELEEELNFILNSCPFCSAEIQSNWVACPECGEKVARASSQDK